MKPSQQGRNGRNVEMRILISEISEILHTHTATLTTWFAYIRWILPHDVYKFEYDQNMTGNYLMLVATITMSYKYQGMRTAPAQLERCQDWLPGFALGLPRSPLPVMFSMEMDSKWFQSYFHLSLHSTTQGTQHLFSPAWPIVMYCGVLWCIVMYCDVLWCIVMYHVLPCDM